MTNKNDGGYDDGYRLVPCLWGTSPGSIVRDILSERPASTFNNVLDLGCGEGKNLVPFALAGCRSIGVDCSEYALANGKRMFADAPIAWTKSDALTFHIDEAMYDLIIAYGLFHCLPDQSAIRHLTCRMKMGTAPGGMNVICTFNDRSQDLRAHPGFQPLLLSHSWYLDLYSDWNIISSSDSDLHETHPHNGISHHHSLTRILARRQHGP